MRKKKKSKEAVKALPKEGRGKVKSDVLGSYTGMDCDGSAPQQDADDL